MNETVNIWEEAFKNLPSFAQEEVSTWQNRSIETATQEQRDFMWQLSQGIPFYIRYNRLWTKEEIYTEPMTYQGAERNIAHLRAYLANHPEYQPRPRSEDLFKII